MPDLPAELPSLDPGLVHIDVAALSEEEMMELSRRSAAAPFAALHARDRMPGIPATREAQVTGEQCSFVRLPGKVWVWLAGGYGAQSPPLRACLRVSASCVGQACLMIRRTRQAGCSAWHNKHFPPPVRG